MSPNARRKQHARLWWRTWHRQHARAIRRRERLTRETAALLHRWAVWQDGQEATLTAEEQRLYARYRHREEVTP